MPTYSRKCLQCQKTFTIWRTVDDRDKDTDCEECGSKSKRVFDTYTNDYKPSHSRHRPPPGYENR